MGRDSLVIMITITHHHNKAGSTWPAGGWVVGVAPTRFSNVNFRGCNGQFHLRSTLGSNSSATSSSLLIQSRKHLTNQPMGGGFTPMHRWWPHSTKAVADKDKGQSISGPRCNGDGPVTVQIWFVRQVQVVIENIFRSCGQLEKRDVWAIGFYECRDTGGRPFPPDETHSITLSAHPQRWLTLTMIASEITLRTSKKNWPHLGTGPKRLEASWWSAYIMKRV